MPRYTAIVLDDRRLELPQGALSFAQPGQVIEVYIEDIADQTVKPNEAALAMLRDIAEMKKDMSESDPSDTDRLIREARAGAMFGYEPTETQNG